MCLDVVDASDLLAVLPCGHRCVCARCGDALLRADAAARRRCPKCRAPLTGVLRVFDE